ncbi:MULTISPECIES: hypothetical protein [unclassified Curtobacterium]|uniref:hypothetical protein n=1 Tax=unclassified Curtobacterium TaxID=257496 RepID=UPI000DA8BC8B|nr:MULTISPECIES: hypothetical protein [unclassified Curtobacterium]PZE64214.1 hypothetical protein DEJ12_17045 [Curtobacterium sp. MCLR17_059]PZF45687.1 hypothetical protein DEJ10_17290 [Curtobacterium sp. MCLR17_057]
MGTTESTSSNSGFGKALVVATKLPGVRIDRAAFLRRSLARYCTEEQIRTAVAETPAAAGIPAATLRTIADASITNETSRVTAISAAAGIPGGFALAGTIPIDSAQYLAHMLRIAQKLAYLYSWPDLFGKDGDEPDDGTQNLLTLFVGVMFGVQAANKGIGIVAEKLATQMVKQLPKQALTHGMIYPIVKTVAKHLGVQMSKSIFAKGVAKTIPVVGGVFSGGLTLATFLPMAKRLRKHLATLETANPTSQSAAITAASDKAAPKSSEPVQS